MLEKSFGLLFFLKQPKNQENSERYVYLRITVDGIAKELSTKRIWDVERWNQHSGRAVGTKEDAKSLNGYLDSLGAKIYAAKTFLLDQGKAVTAEALRNTVTGQGPEKKTLLNVFNQYREQIKALVGKGFSYRTLQRYNTTFDHTKAFIKWKFNREDVALDELNYEFASDFSFWLRTQKSCGHNAAMKYISTVKTILKECMKKKWLRYDPFIEFKTSQKEVDIIPLTKGELLSIQNKEFSIQRLSNVKDIFLFSCYTGLAYVDVSNLKRAQIDIGMDGEKWIVTKRQKTGTPSRIPLLPPALQIIEKYKEHPKCSLQGYVLPVLTNQKMNAYLKEIADTCGIDKKLTFHIARHTFATTVTLSNGVPIETVSKMLGHKSLKQTQHYAKIIDLKVSQDMQALRKKLDRE
jgi:site-specific recombinase XerD